jgi:uncharacterized membrane protein
MLQGAPSRLVPNGIDLRVFLPGDRLAARRELALPAAASLVLIAGAAGLLGSLADSLLGATLQAIYHCPACGKFTERHPFHTCGTKTSLTRGLVWMNNDAVNALCSLAGALAAAGIFLWMGG